jgi:transcriptional regulator with PAS, ATPase and Fis domain|tara:strand:- start:407 stop:691 length:285 start_codon:yes stop_codon:yes gene_type:complete
MEINKPTFRYLLDRLIDIKTQSDLEDLRDEFQDYLPLDQYEEHYDIHYALDEVKRDYIRRAIDKSKNLKNAANLLGLKSYQVLQNWMYKLDIEK